MKRTSLARRRAALQGMGALGAFAAMPARRSAAVQSTPAGPDPVIFTTKAGRIIRDRVFSTPFIDTHEHLVEEHTRFAPNLNPRVEADDWSVVLSHYLNSDMITAGMPDGDYRRFFAPGVDPIEKWTLLEPVWPAVKNTGYGQAVVIAMRELYGVDRLDASTVAKVQEGYEKVRRPGFYRYILRDVCNIETCQVNSLEGVPFMETAMPDLLMQDLSIVGMFVGPGFGQFGPPTGIDVRSLDDWHRVIDWWFDRYAPYATAVKSQNAYSRDIDYEDVPSDRVKDVFTRKLEKTGVTAEERKALEDHLFWYAVRKSTEHGLPVKLHTGFYAGQDSMPLGRLVRNPGSATDLCRIAPDTTFVFMHICYPYYEELIAAAKQWSNASIDMCWSWIINPLAAKDFLKKYLVTAPANKIVTFGGDYIPVEPVVGHAWIARQGIAQALTELVEEGWLSLDDALGLVDPIMHGNARRMFDVEKKKRALTNARWG